MPQPKDKDWLNGYKNKTPIYAVSRDPPQNKRFIQTKSEGLEKKYVMQTENKRKQESQYSYQIK